MLFESRIYKQTGALTSFRLELELSLYGVVSAVQQTAVDGERSQFRVEIQLAFVILLVTLHDITSIVSATVYSTIHCRK